MTVGSVPSPPMPQTKQRRARTMLNKVPEVTAFFWIIKVLATTVGETAADLLSDRVGIGLTNTTYLMVFLLATALVFQFTSRRYVPAIYWIAVVLISVVGTLITDNLVDHYNVSLRTTTILFSCALGATFAIWYAKEKTLSIHEINTTRREAFYWLAILFTFALGTAAGDLIAESLAVGYWKSALMFAGAIGIIAIAYYAFKLNEIVAFWAAYILTRPLGASLGDYFSQNRADGGLQWGTITTSIVFLVSILAVVASLTISRRDQPSAQAATELIQ
jgi:uncharacterized membrane-anchored protein